MNNRSALFLVVSGSRTVSWANVWLKQVIVNRKNTGNADIKNPFVGFIIYPCNDLILISHTKFRNLQEDYVTDM